jgi:hypothetical protein
MPLRDHFHPPLSTYTSWDGFHGQWPAMLVLELSEKLPSRYSSLPNIHLGRFAEVDITTFESDPGTGPDFDAGGGAAAAVWPAKPTTSFETDLLDQDEYEVRIYDQERGRTLVAAIEIVSPSNKDRPESRESFVTKCVALLQNRVSVSIIDLVTERDFNLHREVLERIGHRFEENNAAPALYASSCRFVKKRIDAWEHPLVIGQPLPTLPIWLAEDLVVALDLEPSYEKTCRALRIR